MTLSTSIKSDERLIEPFRTVSSSKTLDTATTQGSKLQKKCRGQNRGDTQDRKRHVTNAKAKFTATELSTRPTRRSHAHNPYSISCQKSHNLICPYQRSCDYNRQSKFRSLHNTIKHCNYIYN